MHWQATDWPVLVFSCNYWSSNCSNSTTSGVWIYFCGYSLLPNWVYFIRVLVSSTSQTKLRLSSFCQILNHNQIVSFFTLCFLFQAKPICSVSKTHYFIIFNYSPQNELAMQSFVDCCTLLFHFSSFLNVGNAKKKHIYKHRPNQIGNVEAYYLTDSQQTSTAIISTDNTYWYI